MVIKHKIGKKCPQCQTVLSVKMNTDKHVEYYCNNCGFKEIDLRSPDVDVRYAPTFKTLPIIKI